jgi:ABC-type transporter lipoprotein component MlaA
MFSTLTESSMNGSLTSYATEYTTTRDAYLLAAKALKEATGPYKATRDAYVAATATYTKSLYE